MKLIWCVAVQIVICGQVGSVSENWRDVRRDRSCLTSRGHRGVCLPKAACGRQGSSNITEYPCKRSTVCCSITRRLYQRSLWSGSPHFVSNTYSTNQSIPKSSIEEVRNKRSLVSGISYSNTFTSEEVPVENPLTSNSSSFTKNSDVLSSNASVESVKTPPSDFTSALPEPPVCGVSQGTFARVVNGNNASLGDFPWIGATAYNVTGGYAFKCGACLITSQHALTAAHCIVGSEDSIYFVRLGVVDINNGGESQPTDALVKTTITHENYNPNKHINDIGLLVFYRRVIFTDVIRPICLPLSEKLRSKDFVDYRPFVAGWGRTSYRGPFPSHLQMLQLPVVTQKTCSEAYAPLTFVTIDERVICAGGSVGKDACNGDSGGPLMQPIWDPKNYTTYFYQTGVVSLGLNCGALGAPGVYTRVTEFIPWIQTQVLGIQS